MCMNLLDIHKERPIMLVAIKIGSVSLGIKLELVFTGV